MGGTVHIIVSCTDRKRARIPAKLRLRSIRARSIAERAKKWWSRLQQHQNKAIPAENLYAGDHWAVARTLPEVAKKAGFRPHLWVASGGYGLVPVEAQLRPYSATFARGHPDSVHGSSRNWLSREELAQAWWKQLARFRGPCRGAPRSVTQLVRQDPGAYLLVAASLDYVRAMEIDLLEAAAQLRQPDRLLIITKPGGIDRSPLRRHVIPSSAVLQQGLGGARISLHARVARQILEKAKRGGLSARIFAQHYRRLIKRSRAVPKIKRQSMSDEELHRFIREGLGRMPGAGWTPLLRSLRESGRACEQKRFKRLFQEVTGKGHAS